MPGCDGTRNDDWGRHQDVLKNSQLAPKRHCNLLNRPSVNIDSVGVVAKPIELEDSASRQICQAEDDVPKRSAVAKEKRGPTNNRGDDDRGQ
jgi:hypothetical protein